MGHAVFSNKVHLLLLLQVHLLSFQIVCWPRKIVKQALLIYQHFHDLYSVLHTGEKELLLRAFIYN